MALEQTLALRNTFTLNQNVRSILPLRFLSLDHIILRKAPSTVRIKCSSNNNGGTSDATKNDGIDDNEQYGATHSRYRRPAVITWTRELNNSVHLIGYIDQPIETRRYPSGKVLAWTTLTEKKLRVGVRFWDQWAEVASQHLKVGQQIYVYGRLTSNHVIDEHGKTEVQHEVKVEQLKLVTERKKADLSGSSEELWQDLFANPTNWWDNRKRKTYKQPDFMHKTTGAVLWLSKFNNPPWVKSHIHMLDMEMGSSHTQN